MIIIKSPDTGAFFISKDTGDSMSAPQLKLYKYNSCPFCMRVMQTIESLNIKVEYHDIMQNPEDFKFHTEKTGRRTVPCLYIDGEPMFESSDITDWLQENIANLEKTN